jgi:hypothetical protein
MGNCLEMDGHKHSTDDLVRNAVEFGEAQFKAFSVALKDTLTYPGSSPRRCLLWQAKETKGSKGRNPKPSSGLAKERAPVGVWPARGPIEQSHKRHKRLGTARVHAPRVAMDAGVIDDRSHLRLIGVYADALRRIAETEGDVFHGSSRCRAWRRDSATARCWRS